MAMSIKKLIALSRAKKPITADDVKRLRQRLSEAEERFKQADERKKIPNGYLFVCTL